MPARWQAIIAYGIQINYRADDAAELNPLRRQPSGVAAKNNLWEIHHDPHDVSWVWVRDPSGGGWITAFWKHLHRTPTTFGELAWDYARAGLHEATEAELAYVVAALLRRARWPHDRSTICREEVSAEVETRRLLDQCPGCGGDVPMATVFTLADLGRYLEQPHCNAPATAPTTDDNTAEMPIEFFHDPGHHPSCRMTI